jgi:predicted RNA binding protein YcfA (HicA-like mRNA interferase family)
LELARLLHRYGYRIARQSGSHLRLTSTFAGTEHHLTIPAHSNLRVGTLAGILADVAEYLKVSRSELERELFERS